MMLKIACLFSFLYVTLPGNNNKTMEEIAAYRAKILQVLVNAKDADGKLRLTEDQAKQLANEFSDIELEEGMTFNTPEEVAELLLDSGLE